VKVVRVEVVALQRPDALVAARRAWSTGDGLRLFEACLHRTPASSYGWLRELVEEFARHADLLVLDGSDLVALYGVPPLSPARRLRASGAGAVLVRMSREISLLVCADPTGRVRADGPPDVVIGLSAAPSCAQLSAALSTRGRPVDVHGWIGLAEDQFGT
jgi:hypothetical protein